MNIENLHEVLEYLDLRTQICLLGVSAKFFYTITNIWKTGCTDEDQSIPRLSTSFDIDAASDYYRVSKEFDRPKRLLTYSGPNSGNEFMSKLAVPVFMRDSGLIITEMNICKLVLTHIDLSSLDMSILSNLVVLVLTDCSGIDTSKLVNLRKIIFTRCPITDKDLWYLRFLETIVLDNCINVKDTSVLKNVKTLVIKD